MWLHMIFIKFRTRDGAVQRAKETMCQSSNVLEKRCPVSPSVFDEGVRSLVVWPDLTFAGWEDASMAQTLRDCLGAKLRLVG